MPLRIITPTHGLFTLPATLACLLFAEGGTSNEFISIRWEQLTALAALIFVLGFIVTKVVPEAFRQITEQSRVFAAASQAQTDSSVKATSEASAKATAAISQMHINFVETLDKMAVRYHDDTTQLADAVAELAKSCAVNCGSGATVHSLRQQVRQLQEEQA